MVPICKSLDTFVELTQNASMDKLACMQANTPADDSADATPTGWQETFEELGGELLDGSGFEHEQPELGFEEEEVS